MHLEVDRTREFSDAEVDRAIALKSKERPPAAHPWPDLADHDVDEIVAEAIKGSRVEARDLPLVVFFEILMKAQAKGEAMPAQLAFQEAERERKAKDEKNAKKR